MLDSVNSMNLYKPGIKYKADKVTVETEPFTSVDDGAPYDGIQVKIKQGDEVVTQYPLIGTNDQELDNLAKKLVELGPKNDYSLINDLGEDETPTPGKDFYA